MSATGHRARIAVVGGGIAGLAAAEQVRAHGHSAEVFEAGPALGGRIAPQPLGEREVCLGGKNVGRRYVRLRELLARHGYDRYELFGPDSAQVVGGQVRPLSFRSPSMRARLGARLLVRGQARGGLRFLRLADHVRQHPESAQLGDRYFAELAVQLGDPPLPDHVGRALCRDVVRHMTVRMNGAEPDECHLGNLGSNLGLVVDRFDQLAGASLPDWLRVAGRGAHLATPVTGLMRSDDGRVAGLTTAAADQRGGFDGVVLAVPAHEAARTLGELAPDLARLLCTVRYFPVAVAVAEYDRPAFPDRFAALTAPAGMALSNAGSYGLRERHLVRYTFSGRAARALVAPERFDPEALLHGAQRFLGRYAPVAQARRLRFAARTFHPGLCAYRRDHALFLREAAAELERLPGLALAGDYLRGASLEACVRSGQEAADRVLNGKPSSGLEGPWEAASASNRLDMASTAG